MNADIPPPTARAFLLCERVIREEGAGRVTLVNIFDRLIVEELPAFFDQLWIYYELAGVRQNERGSVEIVTASDLRPIAGRTFPIPQAHPLVATHGCARMKARFREPGKFLVRFSVGDHLLADRPLSVVFAPPQDIGPIGD